MPLENLSTNQWIILLLVLALGWLLGLLSASGGAKWRRQYEAEREHRIAIERDRDRDRDRDAGVMDAEAYRHHVGERPVVGDNLHRPGRL